ncbi:MAG: energy-coupling factor transporter transmembrane component T [Sulfolobales archaeon]
MRRPSPSIFLIYSLGVTLEAFILRDPLKLSILCIANLALALYMGFRGFKAVSLLVAIGFWGVFINALAVANQGDVVVYLGPLAIREGALKAVIEITLRLLAISLAGLAFISLSDPSTLIRELVKGFRIPPGIAFSLSYALRLIPLVRRDYGEIVIARVERGFRRNPLTPGDIASILMPLLSIGLERAIWAGISAELRGLRLRRQRGGIELGLPEYLLLLLLSLQLLLLAPIPFL